MLTRRQQLGLAAQKKEDSQKGKGRGRGRGRGKKANPEVNDEPTNPDEGNLDKHDAPDEAMSECHGDKSPERRELFPENSGSTPSKPKPDASASKPSEVKGDMDSAPPKKKTRAPRKPKRGATSTPTKVLPSQTAGESNGGTGESKDNAASPPVKQPKKRTKKGPGAKADVPMDAAAEPVAPPAEPKETKGPSDRITKRAKDHIIQARKDPASWFHIQRLWGAMKGKNTKPTPCMKKMEHWGWSMYWITKRVGVLEKRGTTSSHVASFGGGFCADIDLPLEAAYMYVAHSVVVVGSISLVCSLMLLLFY